MSVCAFIYITVYEKRIRYKTMTERTKILFTMSKSRLYGNYDSTLDVVSKGKVRRPTLVVDLSRDAVRWG